MELCKLDARKVMTLRVDCPEDARLVVGQNDFGLLRAICITGGQFEGERLRGVVVPGGADWNTGFGSEDPDHFSSVELFAKYLLQTDDGVYIAVENTARRDKRIAPTKIVTTPRFFAPRGTYEWLNYGVFVASLEGRVIDGVRGVDLTVYQMM